MNRYNGKGLVSLVLLAIAAGCGGSEAELVKVTGEVITAGGQPCDGALVVFHPQEAGKVNDPKPVATTDANGRFTLTTFDKDDGAPAGPYGVTIVWNKASASPGKMSLSSEGGNVSDQLQGRYGDPNNPKLTATVVPPETNDFKFEVN